MKSLSLAECEQAHGGIGGTGLGIVIPGVDGVELAIKVVELIYNYILDPLEFVIEASANALQFGGQ